MWEGTEADEDGDNEAQGGHFPMLLQNNARGPDEICNADPLQNSL